MNVRDAAYCVGRDYPGGAEALAHRLQRPSLSDELNPNRRNKLDLETAVDVTVTANDYRILYSFALACRHFPPIPMPTEDGSDQPCLRALAEVAKQFSALMQEVTDDLDDDRITDVELKRIQRVWNKLLTTGQHLLDRLAAKNAQLHAEPAGELR